MQGYKQRHGPQKASLLSVGDEAPRPAFVFVFLSRALVSRGMRAKGVLTSNISEGHLGVASHTRDTQQRLTDTRKARSKLRCSVPKSWCVAFQREANLVRWVP